MTPLPRFLIRSRVFPVTGRRRWHVKMIHCHGASTLTTRDSHAEAIDYLSALVKTRGQVRRAIG